MSSADYSPSTPQEEREMLQAIGVSGIDELFTAIPPELRTGSFDLPPGKSELELMLHMQEVAGRNGGKPLCFIGGGYYDHFIPAVVDHLAARSEFYTSYTPYQAECSQGTLQALYEYQTAICALTGMEASNASLYDGGSALAEAALMAIRITGKSRVIVDGAVNPFHRKILRTYLGSLPVSVVETPSTSGSGDRSSLAPLLDDDTAAVILQNPNYFGSIDDPSDFSEQIRSRGALLILSVYPISLGLIKSPGEAGADIVTGDGQSLGNHLSFGGPSFGFIATRKKYIRHLPGRIVGETVDGDGRRGFVLTLQAREQHIKRHRATSNICSNQSLCALRGLFFLCSLGRKGVADLARLNRDKAEYAKEILGRVKGVEIMNSVPTFNEFTLVLPRGAGEVVEKLLAGGVAAGVPLGGYFPERVNQMVVTVTEKRTREEIEVLAARLEEALWN